MLNVKDLAISFHNQEKNSWNEVVHQISFAVEKGKVLGIVGESGSGKSVSSFSIIQLLDHINSKVSGSIKFDEISLLSLSDHEMRNYRGNQISMIFQEPMTSLNPVFTCGLQVQEAIQQHQKVNKSEAKKRTIELFNEVKLPRPEQIFESYPHQISGGQKQRVMIAMALSCNPKLLIADEPTTALDVTVQKTILQLLKQLKTERNMAMIFITHDLGVINEIADEVIVMYKGNIVESGETNTVFQNPQHPYTKGLIACKPSADRLLKKLPTVADFLNADSELTPTYLQEQNAFTKEEVIDRRAKLYQQDPLVKVEDLCTWFPLKSSWFTKDKQYVRAVDGVSFEIFPGETLGLVGESGCGKTTLGRTILRLIEPTSGKLFFEGKELTKITQKDFLKYRRDIQIIFQDPYSALNPKLTVGQSIMEPLQVYKLLQNDRERKVTVLNLLEKVGLLPEHFDRYPHEFSGGQRQRIVVARALALQPKFIICDESVSALDVSVQAQVLNLLRDLQNELNLTYIFISHDLSVIKHISDRMIVMNKGRIEEQGFPEDIYTNPQSPYTQQLINAIPGRN